MNLVDVVVLAIVGLSGLVGLFRGAVREIFGLAGLLLGFGIAIAFYADAGEALRPWLADRHAAQAAAFFAILVLAWALFAIAGALLRRVLRLLALSWLDRLGGMAFGVARGALVVSVLAWSFAAFDFQSEELMESGLSRRILETGDRIAGLFPEEFGAGLRRSMEAARGRFNESGGTD